MDAITSAYYNICFENHFLKKKATEFQNFFAIIMEKAYPGDFQRIKPWGRSGDEKNDGYLKSKRVLFQVYAPNEMKAKETIKKIEDDFQGAKEHWQDFFDIWIFVHNSYNGISPEVEKTLLQLELDNPRFKIKNWGMEELRRIVIELDPAELSSMFGPAPTNKDMRSVGFEDLIIVFRAIENADPIKEPDLRPVPADKILANKLSQYAELLLKAGMTKANVVEDFLRTWIDPTLGDRIAEAFNIKYQELKGAGLSPDIIFMELQEFAGGNKQGTPAHQAAVLAVLAHLFENCDIYERLEE